MDKDHDFLRKAIALAKEGVETKAGGPFGAVIVRQNEIIGEGFNQVIKYNDPTAHAEIVAIRNACSNVGAFHLKQCVLYTSCEPCPMCLSAAYWAHIDKIIFACTREDAQNIGFDDAFIYEEFSKKLNQRRIPIQNILRLEGLVVFEYWKKNEDSILY